MVQIELRQTNAYAMQYAVVLGLWHIATLSMVMLSLTNPSWSLPAIFMLPGGFFLALVLTRRFRKEVGGESGFSVYHGFLHTLLMGLFASVWLALFVYLYMRFADALWIFDAYRLQLNEPATVEALNASGMMEELKNLTGSDSPAAIVDILQDIPPMTYAASMLYMSMLASPICALIIGIVCRKAPSRQ